VTPVPGVPPEGATGPKAAWREAVRSVRLQMVLLTFALMLIIGLAAALGASTPAARKTGLL
jgi:hypothetical protein